MNKKTATALSFDPKKDSAPVVKAAGAGLVAENIIKTAEEHQIPVIKDESLANSLARLSLGDVIPVELYEVVAQILVFIAKMDKRL